MERYFENGQKSVSERLPIQKEHIPELEPGIFSLALVRVIAPHAEKEGK
jgi:hypothetical protein